jgi:hypothetical protein
MRRYRTQEVADSSPASSIHNGVQTSDKAVRAEADAAARLAALNLEAVCHRCLRLERIGDDDREAERP